MPESLYTLSLEIYAPFEIFSLLLDTSKKTELDETLVKREAGSGVSSLVASRINASFEKSEYPTWFLALYLTSTD